ncbi:MAG: hypothetical protein LBS55_10145, partial [Prevotellaceae bacterium]|nr:hypothetical protein [Prevotellaceae bacterium]
MERANLLSLHPKRDEVIFMETLRRAYQRLVNETEIVRFRYLYSNIRWTNRLIGILGARGTGKTTLLLQHIRQNFPQRDKALYVSL